MALSSNDRACSPGSYGRHALCTALLALLVCDVIATRAYSAPESGLSSPQERTSTVPHASPAIVPKAKAFRRGLADSNSPAPFLTSHDATRPPPSSTTTTAPLLLTAARITASRRLCRRLKKPLTRTNQRSGRLPPQLLPQSGMASG